MSHCKQLKKIWFHLLICLPFLSSCSYQLVIGSTDQALQQDLSQSAANFENLKSLVLDRKCTACHEPLQAAGLGLSQYEDVKKWVTPGSAESSQLYQAVISGRMPKNGQRLTEKELLFIKEWIDQGAPGSTETEMPTPVPTPTSAPSPLPEPPVDIENTYTKINETIFQPKCFICHNGPNSISGIDLSDHQKVIQFLTPGSAEASTIYSVVLSGWMPLGGPKLSEKEADAIKGWINQGALP